MFVRLASQLLLKLLAQLLAPLLAQLLAPLKLAFALHLLAPLLLKLAFDSPRQHATEKSRRQHIK